MEFGTIGAVHVGEHRDGALRLVGTDHEHLGLAQLVQQPQAGTAAPGFGKVAARTQIHQVAHEKIFAVGRGIDDFRFDLDLVDPGGRRRCDGRGFEVGEGFGQLRLDAFYIVLTGSGGKGNGKTGKNG